MLVGKWGFDISELTFVQCYISVTFENLNSFMTEVPSM